MKERQSYAYRCARDGEITAEEFAQLFAQSRRGEDDVVTRDNNKDALGDMNVSQDDDSLVMAPGDVMALDDSLEASQSESIDNVVSSTSMNLDKGMHLSRQHLRSRRKRRRLRQRKRASSAKVVDAVDFAAYIGPNAPEEEKKSSEGLVEEAKPAASGLDPLFLAALAEAEFRRSEAGPRNNDGNTRRRSLRSRVASRRGSAVVESAVDKIDLGDLIHEETSTKQSDAAVGATFDEAIEPAINKDGNVKDAEEVSGANDWRMDLAREAIAIKVRDTHFGLV